MSEDNTTVVKKRAPTLYVIIAIKLLKGALLVLLAAGVYRLNDENLPEVFSQLLQFLHLDPENQFFSALLERVAHISSANVIWFAGGTVLYSLFSLVEGIGLIFRVSWAGWMAIGESVFFIPIEVFKLVHNASIAMWIVLALNVFIVWYLLQNRRRLFRHHHH
jgi:uncharacterized membrane protein (DUF2068 family)